MRFYTGLTQAGSDRIKRRLEEIGQSRPMKEKTMDHFSRESGDPLRKALYSEGPATSDRRIFPATDNIAEEMDLLIRRMQTNNTALDDIADRTVGYPPPETSTAGLDVAPSSIADRVRMLDMAISRYESLLGRF